MSLTGRKPSEPNMQTNVPKTEMGQALIKAMSEYQQKQFFRLLGVPDNVDFENAMWGKTLTADMFPDTRTGRVSGSNGLFMQMPRTKK